MFWGRVALILAALFETGLDDAALHPKPVQLSQLRHRLPVLQLIEQKKLCFGDIVVGHPGLM